MKKPSSSVIFGSSTSSSDERVEDGEEKGQIRCWWLNTPR